VQNAQDMQQEVQFAMQASQLFQTLATEAQQVADADLYDERSILHIERWKKLEQDTLQTLREYESQYSLCIPAHNRSSRPAVRCLYTPLTCGAVLAVVPS
jgi:hypothetical protein